MHKFLQSRQRGALFTNARYYPGQQPAFDWITLDDLKTNDKTIRESVESYDPAVEVVVFVFLPLVTGNSVAMWMRKIDVPNSLELLLENEIQSAIKKLRDQEDQLYGSSGAKSMGETEIVPLNIPLEPPPLQRPLHVSWDITGPSQSSKGLSDNILRYRNDLYQVRILLNS